MIVKKHYTKYLITEGGISLGAKIGDCKISIQGKNGYQRWLHERLPKYDAWKNTFVFKQSDVKTIESFAKIFAKVAKLYRESQSD